MEEKTWYGVFDGRSAVCWLYDNPEDARKFGNGGPKHPIGGGAVYPAEINEGALTNKRAMLLLIIAHAKRTSFDASTIKIMQETGVDDWSQIPFGELVSRAGKCGFADLSIGPSPKMVEYLNQNRVYGYTYGNMICYWNPRVIRNRGDRAIRKPRALKEGRLDRIVAESTRRTINEISGGIGGVQAGSPSGAGPDKDRLISYINLMLRDAETKARRFYQEFKPVPQEYRVLRGATDKQKYNEWTNAVYEACQKFTSELSGIIYDINAGSSDDTYYDGDNY